MFDNIKTLKLVFTGEKGAGTNTIVSEFIESLNESFEPNYKDNYGSLIIKVDGKKVKLSIFCGSLNKDFETCDHIFENSSAVVLVYSKTIENSLEEIKNYWFEKVKNSSPKSALIAIVENKEILYQEKEDSDITQSDGYQFANQKNALFFKVSVKYKRSLNDMFMGITKKILEIKKQTDELNNKKDNGAEKVEGKGCCTSCQII